MNQRIFVVVNKRAPPFFNKWCAIIWIFSPKRPASLIKWFFVPVPCAPPGSTSDPQFQGSAVSDCCFLLPWRHPDSHVDTWKRWKILGITRSLIILRFSFPVRGNFRACVQLGGGWSDRRIADIKSPTMARMFTLCVSQQEAARWRFRSFSS